MSDWSRYVSYSQVKTPRKKRSQPLYGEGEDTGKYYRCWYCGQINNADKRQVSDADGLYTIPIVADNLSLWLQFEGSDGATTTTDSGPSNHTITFAGNAQISTDKYRHGSSSLYLDNVLGTSVTIADHADFNFSGGEFSISGWFNYSDSDLTSLGPYLYYQFTDSSDDAIGLRLDSSIVNRCVFFIKAGGTTLIQLTANADFFYPNNWNHIEVDEDGDNYYLFINGKQADYVSSTSRAANYTGSVRIGSLAGGILRYTGYIDDFVVRKQAWHTSSFYPSKVDCYYPDVSTGCLFCGSPNYR